MWFKVTFARLNGGKLYTIPAAKVGLNVLDELRGLYPSLEEVEEGNKRVDEDELTISLSEEEARRAMALFLEDNKVVVQVVGSLNGFISREIEYGNNYQRATVRWILNREAIRDEWLAQGGPIMWAPDA